MDPSDSQVARERARRDLEDIQDLKKSSSFERYWLRRLRQKKEEAERSFKYDKLDHYERETKRMIFVALEELEKMMDVDEGNIRAGRL